MIGEIYSDILFVRFLFKDNLVYLRIRGEAIIWHMLQTFDKGFFSL